MLAVEGNFIAKTVYISFVALAISWSREFGTEQFDSSDISRKAFSSGEVELKLLLG